MLPDKYRTTAAASTATFRDRGSEFIAFAFPVKTTDEAKAHIKALKKAHPKANHYCVAWRMGHGDTEFRAGDDGEPSGSAGRPMLGAIDAAGLTNILVVVVRYFGGTLLGVPGLIHAYKTVTETALQAASIEERWIEAQYRLEFSYAAMGEVLHLLKAQEATVHSQDMQLFCVITAGIPLHAADTCAARLSEICSSVERIKPNAP